MTDLKLQSAVIVKCQGEGQVVNDLSIPSPEIGQLLVRTHAVGINPSDWMALDTLARPGAGMGYDFSGEVVEIGEGVHDRWSVGDRVAGFVHGCHAANYSIGAFRQYLNVDAELVVRLPSQIPSEDASTLGMGISTAAQALYQVLALPLPEVDPTPTTQTILIYGGSAATGSLGIQFAKLSGLRVITTCSSQNVAWVQSLGPDEIVDYKSPDAVQQIRNLVTETGLSLILDCVANDETAKFCYKCFTPPKEATQSSEYAYASLMPVPSLPTKADLLPASVTIRSAWNFVYTCFGRRFTVMGKTWEPSVEDKAFMTAFYRRFENLIASDKVRPMPHEIKGAGLQGVLEGISVVRAGKVRAKKLFIPSHKYLE